MEAILLRRRIVEIEIDNENRRGDVNYVTNSQGSYLLLRSKDIDLLLSAERSEQPIMVSHRLPRLGNISTWRSE